MEASQHGLLTACFTLHSINATVPIVPQRGAGLWKNSLREIGWDGMDWIDLAEDRDQWRALVNMVMNLWVP
jgi:hypothetical protein